MLSTSSVGNEEALCKFQEPPYALQLEAWWVWGMRSKCCCLVMIIWLLCFIQNGNKPIYGLKGLRSCLPLLSLH